MYWIELDIVSSEFLKLNSELDPGFHTLHRLLQRPDQTRPDQILDAFDMMTIHSTMCDK